MHRRTHCAPIVVIPSWQPWSNPGERCGIHCQIFLHWFNSTSPDTSNSNMSILVYSNNWRTHIIANCCYLQYAHPIQSRWPPAYSGGHIGCGAPKVIKFLDVLEGYPRSIIMAVTRPVAFQHSCLGSVLYGEATSDLWRRHICLGLDVIKADEIEPSTRCPQGEPGCLSWVESKSPRLREKRS